MSHLRNHVMSGGGSRGLLISEVGSYIVACAMEVFSSLYSLIHIP